jgi:hypothetical protein
MIRNCVLAAACLVLIGCGTVPKSDDIKGAISNTSNNEMLSRIRVIDERMKHEPKAGDQQGGGFLAESVFSPSSLEFVRTVMCDLDCAFFAETPWILRRYQVGLEGGRKMGDLPKSTPIPIGMHPGAAALGILIGGGLVSLMGSSASIQTYALIELERDGKVLMGEYLYTATGKPFNSENVRTATQIALDKLRRTIKFPSQ